MWISVYMSVNACSLKICVQFDFLSFIVQCPKFGTFWFFMSHPIYIRICVIDCNCVIDLAFHNQNHHTATGCQIPYWITQCYLPPAFTPAKVVLDLATQEGYKAELTWVAVIWIRFTRHRRSPISEITRQCHGRESKRNWNSQVRCPNKQSISYVYWIYHR